MHRRPHRLLLALVLGLPLAAGLPGGSMITAILGISFLIFVHEWGHFYACKLTGTRTETFSIGFGPRLFGWEKTRDGVRRFTVGRRRTDPADHSMDFRVAAIPLGGYVKMAGEIPGEGGGGTGQPAPDEFPAKSAWAQSFIICAGVIMNFFTAFVFYTICIQAGAPYQAPLVGSVEQGGAAWTAGVRPGDRIISIDGNGTPTFVDIRVGVAVASGGADSALVVERAGETLRMPFRPTYDEEHGLLRFGVGQAHGLELGTGEATFAVGATEDATVGGIPVRGGADALARINDALQAGILPISIATADGRTYVLAPRSTEDTGKKPGPKVGLAPYVEPKVEAVIGQAAQSIQVGDVLVSAFAAGEIRTLDNSYTLAALPFRAPVTNLVVRRGANTVEIPLDLPDAAAIAAFFDQLTLATPHTRRVTPIEKGALVPSGTTLWRYPAVPAQEAGLPPGATVLKVGNKSIARFEDIPSALESTKAGEPVAFTIRVGDEPERVIQVTPVELEVAGVLDFSVLEYREPWAPNGFGHAVSMGWDRMVRETANVFRTISALVRGQLSFSKNVVGPVRLIGASKQFAEHGMLELLWFLAYVSVMLAVLNILPIPVLDGGHLMFILIGKVRGRPLSDGTIIWMQKIGLFLLLILMFFAFRNDILWILNS
ncbi:MAG: site-2 protease family protein [Planctomycetota bacterium]|nr:site-2 protease family protein [Planctomycetota bacterium]